MKLSNILLASFCTLFIIYVFAVAAEVRFRGEKIPAYTEKPVQKPYDDCTSNYRQDKVLPTFRILKINSISKVGNIRFNADAPNTFSVYAASEAQLPKLEYHTAGDTLFIEKMSKEGLCNEFTLELTEPPQQIIADTMKIYVLNTSNALKSLNLKGSNTSFQLVSLNNKSRTIDSLTVDLDNKSSVHSQSSVFIENLEGKALNNSSILLGNSTAESAQVEISLLSQIQINGDHYNNTDPSVKLIYQKTKQN